MRSTPDRIRHAVSFEIIAIAMVMFLGSPVFGMPPVSMGAVGIVVTQPSEIGPDLKRAQQLNAEGKTVLLDIHSNLEARRSNFA